MKTEIIQPFEAFLRGFARCFGEELTKRFDAGETQQMLHRAEIHFMHIHDQIPDVGSSSPWLKNLIGIAYETGLWRELEWRGLTLTEISVITQRALRSLLLRSVPSRQIPAIRATMCSRACVEQMAAFSQTKKDTDDWLIEAVTPLAGDCFDCGMNIRRCPVALLCRRLDVERYFPYFCLNDYVSHAVMGIRLRRTMTLAHGASCCDFRLTKADIEGDGVVYEPESLPEFTGIKHVSS